MTDPLHDAFRAAARAAKALGNATEAVHAARRRRRRRVVGGTTAAAAVLVAAVAVTTQSMHSSSTPPSGPTTSTQTVSTPTAPTMPDGTPRTSDVSSDAVRMDSFDAPVAVLYRTCAAGACEVGLVDNINRHLQLAEPLADILAAQGLDDVTLSTDGLWVGYPRDGAFTVSHVFDPALSVDVTAGPSGSYWRPYFWTRGSLDLVLAQWVHHHVSALAIVHVGYSNNPHLSVVQEPTPSGHDILPVSVGYSYYNGLSVAERVETSGHAVLQRRRSEDLFFATSDLNTPGLSGPAREVDLASCMGVNETVVGPDGAPLSYVVQPETSADQDLATVVFRSSADGVKPSGVIKGYCSDQDRADGVARYDLPQSTYTDGWTYLGPITRSSSLMLHGSDDRLDRDLVVVGTDGQQVVGQVPGRSEVVAPGGSGGFFS